MRYSRSVLSNCVFIKLSVKYKKKNVDIIIKSGVCTYRKEFYERTVKIKRKENGRLLANKHSNSCKGHEYQITVANAKVE